MNVITGDDGADTPPADRGERRRRTTPAAYAAATGIVALTTVAAAGLRHLFALPDLEVLYFLAVMLAAMLLGRGPAIACAALGVAAYDFWFVPLLFHLRINRTKQVHRQTPCRK